MFFSLFYIFWYSRFSFKSFEDTNPFMFYVIATSSLTICSWCDMTYSQFDSMNIQGRYSPLNKGGPGKFLKMQKGDISA